MLLKPKEFKVKDIDGIERTYMLSRFPAIAGREIIAKYPLSALPKLGDYAINEETMLKLMAFVAVVTDQGQEIELKNRTLVDNHVPDFETGLRIEAAMIEYNCSFFHNGQSLTFFQAIAQKAQAYLIKTLMDLSVQSSKKAKPPSTNSAQSTP